MKVLILGAGGQLGSELARSCSAVGDDVVATSRSEIDIADGARVRDVVRAQRPDVVFNAAAYTAVDRAETEVQAAEMINGRAAGRVAEVCRDLVVRLVHYSTDYVFDGLATEPIAEEAQPAPTGAYGRSKLNGERAVAASGAEAYIVRTSWVYGLEGANFIKTVLRVTGERGSMSVVDDQRGSPTWARDLAVASRRLVDAGPAGTYHLTNAGDCTWYELARETLRIVGVNADLAPITSAEFGARARRPSYSVLSNQKLQTAGVTPPRPWRDALTAYIGERANRR